MAQMAKAWGGTFEDPVYREENLAITGKILIKIWEHYSTKSIQSRVKIVETGISCWLLWPKDTITLGFVRHNCINWVQKTYTTIQKYNNYSVMKKKEV